MNTYRVRAKQGRIVYLPQFGNTRQIVPFDHEAIFPESPALLIERGKPDFMQDLALCELNQAIKPARAANPTSAKAPAAAATPPASPADSTKGS